MTLVETLREKWWGTNEAQDKILEQAASQLESMEKEIASLEARLQETVKAGMIDPDTWPILKTVFEQHNQSVLSASLGKSV